MRTLITLAEIRKGLLRVEGRLMSVLDGREHDKNCVRYFANGRNILASSMIQAIDQLRDGADRDDIEATLRKGFTDEISREWLK